MHSLLAKLGAGNVVLDLGCGGGSFDYDVYPFRTIATDLHMPRNIPESRKGRTGYFQSESATIPLANCSVDAVICHHTLEHFPGYRSTLSEIGRVLRPGGWLWIAVPNGNGFDDRLYRFMFEGGGHVNRFTFDTLIAEVQTLTGLQLLQTCDLFSSFVFLQRPEPGTGYPRNAHFLMTVPEHILDAGVLVLNTATRLIDRWSGSRTSQYGWGFVFGNDSLHVERLPSFFNVCRKCGSGIAEAHVPEFGRSYLGLSSYKCPHCSERNIFVKPPTGLD